MLIGVLMLFLTKANGTKLDFCSRNIWSVVVIILSNAFILYKNESMGISYPLYFCLPLSIIIFLNSKDRMTCLLYISKWFAFLMVPCLLVYLLVQIFGLPSLGTLLVNDDPALSFSYVTRENYFFYNYTDYYEIRFNGPFIEPGHLGMMASFLLYATGFDLKKKETWMILVAVLFTLSLSGYVLTFLAYLFMKYQKGEISMKFIMMFGILILTSYLLAIFYNDGENMVNEMIVSRLEPDEEKGFSGNNRVFGQIDLYFAAMFTDTDLLLTGYDKNTIEALALSGSRGTGFTMWMVQHGLIGLAMAMLFYLVYWVSGKQRKQSFLFVIYVILMFWQRSYPFWFSWIICYVYGITLLENHVFKKELRRIRK